MQILSGKHVGKSSQIVTLNHPDYVVWYISEYPNAKLGLAFLEHLSAFDSRPLVARCFGCKGSATRSTAYNNNVQLMHWCDQCDPYGSGAVAGKLSLIRTYFDALGHVVDTCDARKADMKLIIRGLGKAKGLPTRVTISAAEDFLC